VGTSASRESRRHPARTLPATGREADGGLPPWGRPGDAVGRSRDAGLVSGRQRIALDKECWLDLREGAVPRHEDLLDELIVTTAWEQETITLFGRKMQQPRLTAWFGIGMDSATRYRTTRPALPWPPALRRIIRNVRGRLYP
jgi:alkylated DNA repair dioxygenase AlkB